MKFYIITILLLSTGSAFAGFEHDGKYYHSDWDFFWINGYAAEFRSESNADIVENDLSIHDEACQLAINGQCYSVIEK